MVQSPLAGAAAPLVHTGFVAGSYKFYSWLTQKYTLWPLDGVDPPHSLQDADMSHKVHRLKTKTPVSAEREYNLKLYHCCDEIVSCTLHYNKAHRVFIFILYSLFF